MKNPAANLETVFRVHCSIIRFVRAREHAVRADGLEPLQYQFLSLIGPNANGNEPNISAVARQLGMRHHSAVELVDRLVKRGLVERRRGKEDRRHVFLHVTAPGKKLLRRLVVKEHADVCQFAPELVSGLRVLLNSHAKRAIRSES
jgi:DNA-binding MarR family transcriptional regulator